MKKIKTNFHLGMIAFLILGGAVFNSCYYDYGLEPKDYDLVATFFNDKTDFTKFRTYSMPDTIVHITGDSTQADSELIDRKYDKQILQRIGTNLESLGYTKVEVPDDPSSVEPPDVVVLVSALATKNYSVYSWWPGWWGGWGGWGGWGWYPGYGPGYGPGYPWYPGGTTVYSYTVGTLSIDMIDPTDTDEQNKRIGVAWIAAINGYLEKSSGVAGSRLNELIDQCFTQSPYLKTN